jgi:tetratricopeptide (TPR) repeat protein
MTKEHNQQWLTALVVTAAASAISMAIFAQTPPGQSASASSPAVGKVAGPQFQPTPEQIADSLMAHQHFQEAIASYQKATPSADVWNKTGVAYQLMFNLADAARCYQAALKIDPKNSIVINNLGTIYVSLKEYSKAEKAYRKALRLDPKSALVQKNLGTVLLAEHKYKKGWQSYQEALALDPNIFERNNAVRVENPASLQERGAMNYYMAKGCVRAGQTDRAIEYLRMALNEGFTSPKKLASDGEFAALRDMPAFQQLLADQRSQ